MADGGERKKWVEKSRFVFFFRNFAALFGNIY